MQQCCTHSCFAGMFNKRTSIVSVMLFLLLLSSSSFANTTIDPEAEYDEVLILLNVPGAGQTQVSAVVVQDTVYLSVAQVFNFIRIKTLVSHNDKMISGFYITPDAPYAMYYARNEIEYKGTSVMLDKNAFFVTVSDVYLRLDLFSTIFDLECKFNFRNLSVIVSSQQELPVFKEMREAAIRANLSQLNGAETYDTVIGRSHNNFSFTMADWNIIYTKNFKQRDDTRLNVSLGGVLWGGETNISLNYRNNMPFTERQQFYQWRMVNNDHPFLKQVRVGKLVIPSISTIVFPIVGAQVTNAPATYRRSFGSYTVPYFIEAEWTAELYVNGNLVDYAKAAVTGTATFEVPLVYGYSAYRIRMYSPWGEEKIVEQNIVLPFNFLPHQEFEYTVTAGVVQDSVNSRFTRAIGNYGLTPKITVGAGIEYLSSVFNGATMPFVHASYRMSAALIVSGEYTYGVRSKIAASYRHPSNFQVEVNYTKYKQDQKAINNTFLEERKITASFPFRKSRLSLFTRTSLYQVVLPRSKYTTVESLFSGVIGKVNTNFTTYAFFTSQPKPFIYSSLTMSFRGPSKIIFTPQVQYEYSTMKWMSVRAELGKYINSKGYCHVFYENNFKNNFVSFGAGFKYDLSFALTGMAFISGTQGRSGIVNSAAGSLLYNANNKQVEFNNRSNVGRGLLTIAPFLDVNGNGKRDPGEAAVTGVSVRLNGGRVRLNKDSTILISDLESYSSYIIHLSELFENVAWNIKNKKLKVTAEANQFKRIDIPVSIQNEVSGAVFIADGNNGKGISGITVQLFQDGIIINEKISASDGFFAFDQLVPGSYEIRVNPWQIEKLGLSASAFSIPFNIKTDKDGDYVEGLKFMLKKK